MLKEQDIIVKLLTTLFPNAKVYLFGSRARGTHKIESDIDIAIDDLRKIPILEMARARNILESLNIPQTIDLIDINNVSEDFKKIILKEGIIWKN